MFYERIRNWWKIIPYVTTYVYINARRKFHDYFCHLPWKNEWIFMFFFYFGLACLRNFTWWANFFPMIVKTHLSNWVANWNQLPYSFVSYSASKTSVGEGMNEFGFLQSQNINLWEKILLLFWIRSEQDCSTGQPSNICLAAVDHGSQHEISVRQAWALTFLPTHRHWHNCV